jgi:hypothetical protein
MLSGIRRGMLLTLVEMGLYYRVIGGASEGGNDTRALRCRRHGAILFQALLRVQNLQCVSFFSFCYVSLLLPQDKLTLVNNDLHLS